MTDAEESSFLDKPVARFLALLILVVCGMSIADLYRRTAAAPPGETIPVANIEAATACLDARHADIDQMVADGTIEEAQATLFKQRAEAMCHDTTSGGQGSAPPLPGLPTQ